MNKKKAFIIFALTILIKMGVLAQQKDGKPVGIIPDNFKSLWRGTFIPSALKKEKKVLSLNDISASIKNLEEQPFETDLEEVKRLKDALEKEKGGFAPSEIAKPVVSIVNANCKVYTVRKMKIVKRSSKPRKKKRPCNCQ